MRQDTIPDGFFDPNVAGFVGNLGPIYRMDRDGHVLSGFVVEERHCNPSGSCHGGWLSTFADVSLAREAGQGSDGVVTMSMAIDFLRPVREGHWVESRCEVVRKTATTCFVHGIATAAGETVLRMNAIFRQIRKDHPADPPGAQR